MEAIKRLDENIGKLDAVRKKALVFLDSLTDKKSFVEMGTFVSGTTFADGVSAEGEGIITGYATISNIPVYMFYQNFDAMRGSFSSAQADKIASVIKASAKAGVPFISIIDSAGARINEGAKVLEGYSKIIKLSLGLKGVAPHIAVVKGSAVGLMSTYACTADFVIYDEKGYLTFGAPSVVLNKSGINDTAEKVFGADEGIHSGICTAKCKTADELKTQIYTILSFISGEVIESDNPNRKLNDVSSNNAIVLGIADKNQLFELGAGYTDSIKTYFARINGNAVGVLSCEGLIKCGELKKIRRFVSLLDAYNIPLITLVNSNGFDSDIKKEKHAIANISADTFEVIALSNNPKISVITGSAIGGVYSLLCSKGIGFDYTLAFADAKIAPLSGEQAVNFFDNELKGDATDAKQKLIDEYTLREGNPFLSAKDGYIDNIIDGKDIRAYLASALAMML